MIQTNKINGTVYLTVDGSEYAFSANLKGLLENEKIISKLTMEEIFDLLIDHGGIPENFKDTLSKKIKLYGDSEQVASFTYKGVTGWLDKSQRSSILNLLNLTPAMSAAENAFFNLALNQKVVIIPIADLIDLITKLENYSYQCLVTTTRHLEAVQNLENLDDILNYDYTTGYPDKVVIE